ncbi:MAG: thioredoxin family protein [Hyphomicrobiales bacterium]
MTPIEEAQFRAAGRGVPHGTILKLVATPDESSVELSRFCESLAILIPQISISREAGQGQEHPLLLLPDGLRYQGIPQGNEVRIFVDALAGTIPPLSDPLRDRLKVIAYPSALDLYITPQCTYCPQVVRRLVPLASASRLIRLSVIDATMYPEQAKQNSIKSVPALILDGQFRWTGSIDLEDVVALMLTRDPASLSPTSLEMMLREGAARRLAQMMAERGAVFPALIELLCHDQWPVRLGAMVAMEELQALRPELAAQVIEPLWNRLGTVSDTIKGDLLHVFGELGGPEIVPKINAVLEDKPPAEIKEAAEEALGKIREKFA